MIDLQIKAVQANHPHLQQLIQQLDVYLMGLYPPDEVFVLDPEASTEEDVQFVIAYYNDVAVGCGAITKLSSKIAELKRFFVLEPYRNRGIASAVLQYLESEAASRKYTIMRLETGGKQEEALSFYHKKGYTVIDRFGPYVNCSSSICMEKKL